MAKAPKSGFADDRQVGNPVWALSLIFIAGICLAPVLGCTALQPRVQSRVIGGEVFIEHIDTNDAPAPCGISHLHGCYAKIAGVKNVWYSELAPSWVPTHEVYFHGRGGEHGPYQQIGIGHEWCAQITKGIAGYPQGAWLCNDRVKEYVMEVVA